MNIQWNNWDMQLPEKWEFSIHCTPPPKKKKRKQNNEVIEFSRAKLILTPFLVFCRESWLVEDRKLA